MEAAEAEDNKRLSFKICKDGQFRRKRGGDEVIFLSHKRNQSTLYMELLSWCIMLLLISCNDPFRMDYVPTPEEVKDTLPEFIIEYDRIEGLDANMDVVSMTFRYTFKANTKIAADDIVSMVVAKAQKEGWQLTEKQLTSLRFNRFSQCGKFFCAEEVRVIVIPKNLRVYVAWVEAMSRKQISRFEDTTHGKWAKRVIWPKLESYVAQEK